MFVFLYMAPSPRSHPPPFFFASPHMNYLHVRATPPLPTAGLNKALIYPPHTFFFPAFFNGLLRKSSESPRLESSIKFLSHILCYKVLS